MGFGLANDIAALRRRFPALRSLENFATLAATGDGVADIEHMVKLSAAARDAGLPSPAHLTRPSAAAALRRPMGLSAACRLLLGRALDKTLQVMN